jgi:hypothetical protein
MEKGRESGTSPAAYPTWYIRSKKDGFSLLVFRFLVTFLERMYQVASTGRRRPHRHLQLRSLPHGRSRITGWPFTLW